MTAVWLRAGLCALFFLTAGCSWFGFRSEPAQRQPAEDRAAREDAGTLPHVSPRARELFALARSVWDEQDQCRDPAAAIGWLDAALEIQPEYGDALIWRGRALSESGYLEDAFDDLTRAIRLQPSALAYAERGLTGLRLGAVQGAARDLEHALSLDEDEARAYVYRAALRFAQGETPQACSDLAAACARGLCLPRDKAAGSGLCP
ncbi:MAG: hypothetical protein J1E80_01785 [Desulfovibrionaceae bacterium]|nr:hypothetical protein [Desulfovibrionaceae bacterium]